jgi:uncharacterized protein (DUF4415 family)
MSENHIVRKSQDEIRRELAEGKDRTDWERLRETADGDIECAVRDDPDAVLLDEEWLRAARVVQPSGEKEQISIRIDKEVLDYFRSEGGGYQTRINDVLKAYVLVRRMQEQEEKQ